MTNDTFDEPKSLGLVLPVWFLDLGLGLEHLTLYLNLVSWGLHCKSGYQLTIHWNKPVTVDYSYRNMKSINLQLLRMKYTTPACITHTCYQPWSSQLASSIRPVVPDLQDFKCPGPSHASPKLMDVIPNYNLKQHMCGNTHELENTLDLQILSRIDHKVVQC